MKGGASGRNKASQWSHQEIKYKVDTKTKHKKKPLKKLTKKVDDKRKYNSTKGSRCTYNGAAATALHTNFETLRPAELEVRLLTWCWVAISVRALQNWGLGTDSFVSQLEAVISSAVSNFDNSEQNLRDEGPPNFRAKIRQSVMTTTCLQVSADDDTNTLLEHA